MKTTRPEVKLEHVLTALERELIAATDEEVLAAAAELGIDPAMKGSAAFVGVKSPLVVRSFEAPGSEAADNAARLTCRAKDDVPTST